MDILTGDDVVTLIPFNVGFLKQAALLYNSSGMCYATGFTNEVSEDQLALMLHQICSRDNEFVSGIFSTSDSGTEDDAGIAGDPAIVGASDTANASGTQFVGIVSGVLQENELWIKLLAILPSFRNVGIGTRSISLILGHFAKSFNVTNVFVSVVEENNGGVRFWTKQGFCVTDILYKALFGENHKYKVVIMNKRL